MALTAATPQLVMEELVEFQVGRMEPLPVYGVLHHPSPDAPQQSPAAGVGVILLGGWSGTRVGPHGILVAMARELASAGFHALRFDYRGRGDSGGSQNAAHIGTMVEDTQAAAHFLQSQKNTTSIVLVGMCAGAMVAMAAAPSLQSLRGMALWSPPPFHPDLPVTDRKSQSTPGRSARPAKLLKQYWNKLFDPRTWAKLSQGQLQPRVILKILTGQKITRSPERKAGAVDWAGQKPDERLYQDALPAVQAPALYIYGANDPERDEAIAYYSDLRVKHPTQIHSVEGANHSFYSLEWKREVMSRTLEWIQAECLTSSS